MSLLKYRKVLRLGPEYPAYFASGSRGAGKTVTTEWIGSWYYEHGYLVMSMWGSFDMENAFWCIGDPDRTGRKVGYPVLIIHPRTTIIKPNNPLCVCGEPMTAHIEGFTCQKKMPLIKTISDDNPLADILILAHREKRVVVFNRGFYGDQKEAYRRLAKFLNEYPYLIVKKAIPTNISVCMIFNELGNIAPSGLKGMVGNYETNTKREIQSLIREARHVRTVLVADFQRSGDIAKSIASQRDFLIFKKSTRDLIPMEYEWLYDAIERRRQQAYYNLDFDGVDGLPSLAKLKPWQAYVVFPDRHFELRKTGMAPFRHKKPHDNWADLANVSIEYLEKGDLNKPTEVKVQEILEKKVEKEQRMQTLKDAYRMNKEDKMTYDELAKKFGWLGKDGKPSGEALQTAVRRAVKDGKIQP